MNAALDALRAHARQRNLKLTDFALAIVRGEVLPDSVAPGDAPTAR
jgi:hypothetical protein